MIRFLVGQRWKAREPGAQGPRDSFSLELDGVELLPEAIEEPLLETTSRLLDAMLALLRGERAGQLSLEEAQQELCFWRLRGTQVEVSVVGLTPPRRLNPPVLIDLEELCAAASSCARQLLRDLQARQPASTGEQVALVNRLKELERTVMVSLDQPVREGWTLTRPAKAGLGFTLFDDGARTMGWTRSSRAGLPALLVPGRLQAPAGATVDTLPFLALSALVRQAGAREVRLAGERLTPQAVFDAGLDLCVALRRRNAALAANPWVEALQRRCAEGLAALREPAAGPPVERPTAPRAGADGPLGPPGVLRRMKLEARWQQTVALGEPADRLTLGRNFLAVSGARAAQVFSRRGTLRLEHRAQRSLAVSAAGAFLIADASRVYAVEALATEARWLRDHDGAHLGPTFEQVGETLVTPLDGRGLVGFDALTGRERWRFDPPRTAKTFVSVLGGRILIGTDEGMTHGLDASDGVSRFRIRGPLPCVAAPVQWGHGALCVLGRGEQTVMFACDALSSGPEPAAGAILWNRELPLGRTAPPLVVRKRIFLAGRRDDRTVVLCLGDGGALLWERVVPCEPRGLALTAFEGGVIVSDGRGVVTRLLPDGQASWVTGSAAEPAEHLLPPRMHRRLLVVPGPLTRVIDPRSGRAIAELELGPDLKDLALARNFDLFALGDSGRLTAWRPGTLLSVL